MKSKTVYQLMNVSNTGIDTPVLTAPGAPVEPFELKREAISFAEEHPELIRHGRFTVKAVMILQEEEATADNKEVTTSVEE